MSTHASRAFTKLLAIFSKHENIKWHFTLDTRMFDVGIFAPAVEPISKTLTLNLGPNAIRDLVIDDEYISFSISRGGVPVTLHVPFACILSFIHPNGAPYLWPWFGQDANFSKEEFKDEVYGTPVDDFSAFFDLIADTKIIKFPFPPFNLGGIPDVDFYIVSDLTNDSEPVTVKSKAEALGMRVIEGGKSKMESDPVLVDIHEARKAKRIQALNDIKESSNESPFPKLDITKCFVSRRKVKRPSWLQVIDGGKSIASMDAVSLGKFS